MCACAVRGLGERRLHVRLGAGLRMGRLARDDCMRMLIKLCVAHDRGTHAVGDTIPNHSAQAMDQMLRAPQRQCSGNQLELEGTCLWGEPEHCDPAAPGPLNCSLKHNPKWEMNNGHRFGWPTKGHASGCGPDLAVRKRDGGCVKSSGTNFMKAVTHLNEFFSDPQYGARVGVPKVAIFVTDARVPTLNLLGSELSREECKKTYDYTACAALKACNADDDCICKAALDERCYTDKLAAHVLREFPGHADPASSPAPPAAAAPASPVSVYPVINVAASSTDATDTATKLSVEEIGRILSVGAARDTGWELDFVNGSEFADPASFVSKYITPILAHDIQTVCMAAAMQGPMHTPTTATRSGATPAATTASTTTVVPGLCTANPLDIVMSIDASASQFLHHQISDATGKRCTRVQESTMLLQHVIIRYVRSMVELFEARMSKNHTRVAVLLWGFNARVIIPFQTDYATLIDLLDAEAGAGAIDYASHVQHAQETPFTLLQRPFELLNDELLGVPTSSDPNFRNYTAPVFIFTFTEGESSELTAGINAINELRAGRPEASLHGFAVATGYTGYTAQIEASRAEVRKHLTFPTTTGSITHLSAGVGALANDTVTSRPGSQFSLGSDLLVSMESARDNPCSVTACTFSNAAVRKELSSCFPVKHVTNATQALLRSTNVLEDCPAEQQQQQQQQQVATAAAPDKATASVPPATTTTESQNNAAAPDKATASVPPATMTTESQNNTNETNTDAAMAPDAPTVLGKEVDNAAGCGDDCWWPLLLLLLLCVPVVGLFAYGRKRNAAAVQLTTLAVSKAAKSSYVASPRSSQMSAGGRAARVVSSASAQSGTLRLSDASPRFGSGSLSLTETRASMMEGNLFNVPNRSRFGSSGTPLELDLARQPKVQQQATERHVATLATQPTRGSIGGPAPGRRLGSVLSTQMLSAEMMSNGAGGAATSLGTPTCLWAALPC